MKRICEYCGKEYEWGEGQLNWGKDGVQRKGPGSIRSSKYCCYDCGKKDAHNKLKQTNLKKYGKEYSAQNKTVQEKIKKTKLIRYGDENYNNIDSITKTKSQWTDKKIQSISNTRKQTMLERFGCENSMQNKEIQEKARKTNLERYGVENVSYNDEIKKKIIINSVNARIKNHTTPGELMQDTEKRYNYINKVKSTKIKNKTTQRELMGDEVKRYNYINKVKSTKIKNKTTQKDLFDSDKLSKGKLTYKENYLLKCYETKKKNNSFNTSKSEETIYQKLKDKYKNVKRQYKSEMYPYCCDFYMPEKDLYIEYQGIWTHGKEPYNENDKQHQKQLKSLKEKAKSSKFYKVAIEVWTKSDVEKREAAKKNKLNWIEFFNMDEFDRWLENEKNL